MTSAKTKLNPGCYPGFLKAAIVLLLSVISSPALALEPLDANFESPQLGQPVTRNFSYTLFFNDEVNALELCPIGAKSCGSSLTLGDDSWVLGQSTVVSCTDDGTSEMFEDSCLFTVPVTYTPGGKQQTTGVRTAVTLELEILEVPDREVASLQGSVSSLDRRDPLPSDFTVTGDTTFSGEIPNNFPASNTIKLSNTSGTDTRITIKSVNFEDTGSVFGFADPGNPLRNCNKPLADGESCTLSVDLLAGTAGSYADNLIIDYSWEFLLDNPPARLFEQTRVVEFSGFLEDEIINFTVPRTVKFARDEVTITENTGSFALELIQTGDEPFSVDVKSADITATGGGAEADYLTVDETVTWDEFDTENKSVIVTVNPDNQVEGEETFSVALSNRLDGTVIEPSVVKVTIVDATEPGKFSFAFDSTTIDEEAETLEIPLVIERLGGSDSAVSVRFSTVDGTAVAGSDYISSSGAVQWGAGDTTSREIMISVLDDADIENDEAFFIDLSSAEPWGDAIQLGAPVRHTVTITDGDIPEAGKVRLSSAEISVREDAGFVDIDLLRSGAGTIDFFIEAGFCDCTETSATPGLDFEALSQRIVWDDDGTTRRTVSIPVTMDALEEGDEGFSVSLSGNDALPVPLTEPSDTVVTIVDVYEPGLFQFAQASSVHAEETETITVSVERVGGSTGPASVDFSTVAETALAESDYIAQTGTLFWNDGEQGPQPITLALVNDDETEEAEAFFVQLTRVPRPTGSNATPASLGTPDRHTVNIAENTEILPGMVAFAAATSSVNESDQSLTLALTRSGAGAASVTVSTVNGSAVAGQDYDAISVDVEWLAGEEGNKSVTVPINRDDLLEGDETFQLTLESAIPGIVSANATAEVTIADSTQPGKLQFSGTSVTVLETEDTVLVTVDRIGGGDGAVTVDFAVVADTAQAGEDFVATSGQLEWSANDAAAKQIVVDLLPDQELEAVETIHVDLSNAMPWGDSNLLGTPARFTIAITDPGQPGTVQFASRSLSVNEADGEAIIELLRTGDTPISVSVETESGTALADEDFTSTSTTLAWARGESGNKQVTIPLLADALDEETESFVVRLTSPDVSALGSNTLATVDIVDTFNPGMVRMVSQALSIREGEGELVIAAERVGGRDGPVSVSVVVEAGTAILGEDFVAPEVTTLSWASGTAGQQTVTIPITPDENTQEQDEQFSVRLRPLGENAVVDEASSETVVTIENNLVPGSDANSLPFKIVIVSGDEQEASIGDTIGGMVIEVQDTRTDDSPTPGIDVAWTVQPPGAAEFTAGISTASDSDGRISQGVRVLQNGFIRVVASVTGVNGQPPQIASKQARINPPAIELQDNQAAFVVRAGLSTRIGLSRNQSETGRALDSACDALRTTAPAPGSAQADLLATCDALDVSASLPDDLDALAPEEALTIADSIVDISDLQVTNVYARINAIRAGRAQRLDLSQLRVQIYDQTIPGSVVDAAQNAINALSDNEEKAALDSPYSKFGVFANGTLSVGEVDGRGRQQDADIKTNALTLGVDYRLGSNAVVGVGFGYNNTEADFTRVAGGTSAESFNLTLFGTWYDEAKGHLDAVLDIGRGSYDLTRRISLFGAQSEVFALSDTQSSVISLTGGASKDFKFGNWETGPYLRFSVVEASVDGYTEQASSQDPGFGSALRVDSHDVSSKRFSLGGQLSSTVQTARAIFVPQLRVEFEAEIVTDKDEIRATFIADPSAEKFTIEGNQRDSGYINVGIGSVAVFPKGKSGYLFYETRLQHDFVTQHWIKAGFRIDY